MMTVIQRAAIAMICAVALAALSACGGDASSSSSPPSSPTPTQASGIQGTTMMAGGPVTATSAPQSPRPDPGKTVAVRAGDVNGKTVATVRSDSTGAFTVDLPPGTYTLDETSVNAVRPQTVTVVAEQYVTVTLVDHIP